MKILRKRKFFITYICLKKIENEILAIKHVKEVSKKKVTFAKIEQFTKRNKIEISTEELNRIIENLVNTGVMQMQGENQNTTYNLSGQPESNDLVLMSHAQEPSSSSSQKFYIRWRWRSCTWICCFCIKHQHRTRPYECNSKRYNLIKTFSGNCSKETL